MQSCWLKQDDNSSCILFFTGWGMDPNPFLSVSTVDYDLLMVYDYREVEPEAILNLLTGQYDSLHLIAWSMGVWIAGKFFAAYKDRFSSAMAINGTLAPIDDQYGIPPKAFDIMIREFSPALLDEFYRDMFDKPDQTERFLNCRPQRSAESILGELQTLHQMYAVCGPGDDIFDRKLIASRDRIFPARSQLHSWGKDNCERIKGAHFPFYDWSSWDHIIGEGQVSCD